MNDDIKRKPLRSFKDLEVYQSSYKAMILVMKEIVPKLPEWEKYDLTDQTRRACKAVPRLIAEGFAKKHQRMGFQKYLDDATGESNEMIVCLETCKDVYPNYIDVDLCIELIKTYDITSRQLYNLSISWSRFKEKSSKPKPTTYTATKT